MKRCIDQFATAGERTRASRLIDALLSSVPAVALSVCDGEEWTVKQSRNKGEVMAALATTGEDIIKVRDAATCEHIASFYLVWGNATDGSELVADHTDNELARKFS